MSEVASIYQLIPRVMADIGGVAKTRKNEQQRYNFRGIEDFYLAAHPAMIAHGVFCAPEVQERTEYRFEKTNDQGRVTTWLHVALKVQHKFYGPDGSFVAVTTWGEGLDNSDKATNKAMSGAMKYALIELFCVPTQDVEDADRTTPENGTRRPPVARITEDIPLTKSSAGHNGQAVKSSKGPEPTHAADKDLSLPGARAAAFIEACAEQATDAPAVEYCTREQQDWLRLEFKAALPAKYSATAEKIRHDWLQHAGYTNARGEGTSTMIPRAKFKEEAKACIRFAKELGE